MFNRLYFQNTQEGKPREIIGSELNREIDEERWREVYLEKKKALEH